MSELNKVPITMLADGTAGKIIGCLPDGTRVDITHARFTHLYIQKVGGAWVEARVNDSEEWTFTPTTDPDA